MNQAQTGEQTADVRTPRRVLMVAPQPCFEARGTPMNIQLMCRTLIDLGYEVHLATFPFGETVPIPGLTYHRVGRIPFVHRVPIGFSVGKVFLDVLLILKVFRLFAGRRFSAVHAIEEAAFFAVPLGRIFRTPTIVDLDSNMFDQLLSSRSLMVRMLATPARLMRRWTTNWSTCALTVCKSLTDEVKQLCPTKKVFQIEDVPLPSAGRLPDAAKVDELRRELSIDARRVILYTGNLEPYQGVELLLEALPIVVQSNENVLLLVVGGEDEQIAELRERSKALGVSESVHLVGKRDPDSMPEFMGLAEVLVSPRREGENTPLKIYTYMLSGRPIVATRLATHTQVLDDQTAILTAATPAALAEGILQALEDPSAAAQVAQRAREKVQRDHSYSEFRRKLGDVYDYVTRR